MIGRLRLFTWAAVVLGGCGGRAMPVVADGMAALPSGVVRQGQTDIILTIDHAAGGLANPSHVDLGDVSAMVRTGSSDRRLVLALEVPHGAATGMRTLQVSTAAGELMFPDALEVTAITAGPAGADDSIGSAAAPFRSLKKALAVAGAADTIQLLDGAYNTDGGEVWNYETPARLSIVGQSQTGTVLAGSAGGDGMTTTVAANGLRPAGDLTLRSLSMTGFGSALSVEAPAALTLEDVRLADNRGDAVAVGAAAVGSTLMLQGKTWAITGAGAGVSVAAPQTMLSLESGVIQVGGNGVALGPQCTGCVVNVDQTAITSGGADNHALRIAAQGTPLGTKTTVAAATFNGDIYVDDATGTASVTGTSITEAFDNNGVFFNGTLLTMKDSQITVSTLYYGVQLQAGMMSLSGVTIDGGTYGIYHSAGTAALRNTTIKNFSFVGYYLSMGDLDLGTQDDTGGNAFVAPDSGYGLYVARLGQAKPVTCSNTSFNGETPPAGDVTGAVDDKGHYFINVGEVVSFSVR
ncbi:MAG TPA: DUF1565 domain-containing protein [Polyangia bacterium]